MKVKPCSTLLKPIFRLIPGTQKSEFGYPIHRTLLIHNWAKTRKKVLFGKTMHCLPQRLKSLFFEIFQVERGHGVKKKNSNNIDFSLWGNRATTQSRTNIWNWNFFHVLAHCVLLKQLSLFQDVMQPIRANYIILLLNQIRKKIIIFFVKPVLRNIL